MERRNLRRFRSVLPPIMVSSKLCRLAGVLLIAALAGCSTVESRIEEKAAVFNALPVEQQSRIKQGLVDVGFTQDMVYMAMGSPDRVNEKSSAEGHETIWIYNNYYQRYEGSTFAGYHRRVYYDRAARAYRVYYEPVRADVYSDRVEEVARVIFKDGRVSVIEQSQGS